VTDNDNIKDFFFIIEPSDAVVEICDTDKRGNM
jgi:hypothetical protein